MRGDGCAARRTHRPWISPWLDAHARHAGDAARLEHRHVERAVDRRIADAQRGRRRMIARTLRPEQESRRTAGRRGDLQPSQQQVRQRMRRFAAPGDDGAACLRAQRLLCRPVHLFGVGIAHDDQVRKNDSAFGQRRRVRDERRIGEQHAPVVGADRGKRRHQQAELADALFVAEQLVQAARHPAVLRQHAIELAESGRQSGDGIRQRPAIAPDECLERWGRRARRGRRGRRARRGSRGERRRSGDRSVLRDHAGSGVGGGRCRMASGYVCLYSIRNSRSKSRPARPGGCRRPRERARPLRSAHSPEARSAEGSPVSPRMAPDCFCECLSPDKV